MKKLALALFVLMITACTSPSSNLSKINWTQGNLAALSDTAVQLKSNLWIDKMPKVDGTTENQSLNGTLMLDTSGELSAELVVQMVVIKQKDNTWIVQGDETELRTLSENLWEVVFTTEIPVDVEKRVHVALELSDKNGDVWLVERNVAIDKVY
ncbi:hypothetical protein [Vibrio ziniensis]|uniref:DNA polymerase III subunit beta n=1 Tax=Vibrio ziniensis TaxID=2711221 RepID=A0A6G7CKR3_9VIBR|nr:hypothetical protein [Vibrio ziniensis]QIH42633.1 hypothetical protein G5S32_11820 [Vibrio ziniensis]